MADNFQVNAAYDKASYLLGETITVTIAGTNTHTDTATTTVGPVAIPVVSSGGVQSMVSVPMVEVSSTSTTVEEVFIDTNRLIVDDSGRSWVVSADRKSISTIA